MYITLIMSERKISHKINLFDIITTIYKIEILNPIQNGGQKSPRTSFFPVTSTNVGLRSQNFLTFSFSPFATLG